MAPSFSNKIYRDRDALRDAIADTRVDNASIVWTNGCFDILHAGHVTYLDEARGLGDVLVVGLNSDASVRSVKGEGRPVNAEDDRALVLAALASVDFVLLFSDEDAVGILDSLRPDVYCKGGDYTVDTIHQGERRCVEGYGGKIELLSGVEDRSTTDIIRRAGETL